MTPGSLQLCERGPFQPEWFVLAIADYVDAYFVRGSLREPVLEAHQSCVTLEDPGTCPETVQWLVDAELVKL